MKKFLVILFVASNLYLFSSSCRKEKYDLNSVPAVNKMSCFVNGKKWESGELRGGIWGGYNDYNYILIYAYRGRETIYLYGTRPFTTGVKAQPKYAKLVLYGFSKRLWVFSCV